VAAEDTKISGLTLVGMRRMDTRRRLVWAAWLIGSALEAQVPAWKLQPDLRIGGDETGPKSFNDVRGVVATAGGSIAVLEYQAQEIRLFDARGAFLRLLARKGSGPSEVRDAVGIAVGSDDVIWATDPANRRYVRFFPDQRPPEYIPFQVRTTSFIWGAVIDSAGNLFEPNVLVVGTRLNPETGRPRTEYRLRTVDLRGQTRVMDTPRCGERDLPPAMMRVRITSPNGTLRNYPIPFLPTKQLALTAAGRVWCTPSDQYVLFYGKPDSLREVFRKPMSSIAVTKAERERELAIFDSLQRTYGPITSGSPESMPGVKPAIAQIFADDLGRLWVKVTGSPEDTPQFDVISPSGRVVATARATGPIGRFVFVRGKHLYTVVRNEDDIPVVVRYAIGGG
jgi:hypothetical protein